MKNLKPASVTFFLLFFFSFVLFGAQNIITPWDIQITIRTIFCTVSKKDGFKKHNIKLLIIF